MMYHKYIYTPLAPLRLLLRSIRRRLQPCNLIILVFVLVLTFLVYRAHYMSRMNDVLNDEEINSILKITPYLWRKTVFTGNESVGSRIDDQILWIKRISKTDFIRKARTKIILAQKGGYSFDGSLRPQCPYAPDFEKKCKVVYDDHHWRWNFGLLFKPWKYANIDAVLSTRKWNDVDLDIHQEPMLPRHIQQIMFLSEAPTYCRYAPLGVNNALLASYLQGSDIPLPYDRWIPTTSKNATINTTKMDNLVGGKTKMVVAMISNCKLVYNDRMGFIRELQKYVQVDVFGRCGTLTCPAGKRSECMKMADRDYTFFFAVENTNCDGYITEKFFHNGLRYNMIPIVMGAHPENYKTEAPPNSYISVNDFESPKALAEYLEILNKNDSLYKEYFKYKDTGYLSQAPWQDFFCRICSMLPLYLLQFGTRPRRFGKM